MKAAVGAFLALAGNAQAAVATFTPVGPTTVDIGTPVVFDVSVAVTTLSGFNSADVILGSNNARDIYFEYSSAWLSAFSSPSAPQYDIGFYSQSVFAGGSNATSVGTSKLLGRVTIKTPGLDAGTYRIDVSNAVDGFSTLGLNGVPEPLNGFATYSVTRPIPAASTWGLIVMALSILAYGSARLRDPRETIRG